MDDLKDFDRVVLATGVRPRHVNIPGNDHPMVRMPPSYFGVSFSHTLHKLVRCCPTSTCFRRRHPSGSESRS
jgi:hypothetical protein